MLSRAFLSQDSWEWDDRPLPPPCFPVVCHLGVHNSPKVSLFTSASCDLGFYKNKECQVLTRCLTERHPEPSWGLNQNKNYMFGKRRGVQLICSSCPVTTCQNSALINLHYRVDICHSVLPTSETKCDSLLNYFNLC